MNVRDELSDFYLDNARRNMARREQSNIPEPPETVGDAVKAFLTLALLVAAFYAASFVVAAMQVTYVR